VWPSPRITRHRRGQFWVPSAGRHPSLRSPRSCVLLLKAIKYLNQNTVVVNRGLLVRVAPVMPERPLVERRACRANLDRAERITRRAPHHRDIATKLAAGVTPVWACELSEWPGNDLAARNARYQASPPIFLVRSTDVMLVLADHFYGGGPAVHRGTHVELPVANRWHAVPDRRPMKVAGSVVTIHGKDQLSLSP